MGCAGEEAAATAAAVDVDMCTDGRCLMGATTRPDNLWFVVFLEWNERQRACKKKEKKEARARD